MNNAFYAESFCPTGVSWSNVGVKSSGVEGEGEEGRRLKGRKESVLFISVTIDTDFFRKTTEKKKHGLRLCCVVLCVYFPVSPDTRGAGACVLPGFPVLDKPGVVTIECVYSCFLLFYYICLFGKRSSLLILLFVPLLSPRVFSSLLFSSHTTKSSLLC